MSDSKKEFFKEIKEDFKGLGTKVNRIFDDLIRGKNSGEYKVLSDVYQTGTEFVWELDLPGFEKTEVKVQLREENLVISGSRKAGFDKETVKITQEERVFGSFEKIFVIPEGASTADIKAKFENGVLKVTMPSAIKTTTEKQSINID